MEALSSAAEDIVDGAFSYAHGDLNDPGSAWAVILAFAVLARLVAARVVASRLQH